MPCVIQAGILWERQPGNGGVSVSLLVASRQHQGGGKATSGQEFAVARMKRRKVGSAGMYGCVIVVCWQCVTLKLNQAMLAQAGGCAPADRAGTAGKLPAIKP
jgi:hypothetical protein